MNPNHPLRSGAELKWPWQNHTSMAEHMRPSPPPPPGSSRMRRVEKMADQHKSLKRPKKHLRFPQK